MGEEKHALARTRTVTVAVVVAITPNTQNSAIRDLCANRIGIKSVQRNRALYTLWEMGDHGKIMKQNTHTHSHNYAMHLYVHGMYIILT